jgi:hypothetical protein
VFGGCGEKMVVEVKALKMVVIALQTGIGSPNRTKLLKNIGIHCVTGTLLVRSVVA